MPSNWKELERQDREFSLVETLWLIFILKIYYLFERSYPKWVKANVVIRLAT